ncbi:MAG: reverse transcriptase [Sinomicrobium sp.]|nr:reverse transcriptase [Sinomicrobium sp.]
MQLELFNTESPQSENQASISLEELIEAYYQCRKNKRHTVNALAFEVDFESRLYDLWLQINDGSYQPGRSVAFIVTAPVTREIFAADFRDRIVHHLVINKLNPLFEKQFIYDSYSCRKGKGTHFGIDRVSRFIRSCSRNYSRDCYILKLDIEGFFMHIDRKILFRRLRRFIEEKYQEQDKPTIINLCEKVIFNDCAANCLIKGKKSDWDGLPPSKSLFHSPPGCGLPIGNLTSQIFANFYLDAFDHFIKHDLGLRYYGRYVDDYVIVHPDKAYLQSLIPRLDKFLKEQLRLNVHPRKIYLQHYSKGVTFLGAVIKPGRIYIRNRIKGNFYDSLQKWNERSREKKKLDEHELLSFKSSVNSYLGLMKHYQAYNIRRKMLLRRLSTYYINHFYISGGYAKLVRIKRRVRKKHEKFLPVYDRPSWEEKVARRRWLAVLDFGCGQRKYES